MTSSGTGRKLLGKKLTSNLEVGSMLSETMAGLNKGG